MGYIKKFGSFCSATLQWAFNLVIGLLRSVLAIFGYNPAPAKCQHEDIQLEDVAEAYDAAKLDHTLDDTASTIDTRLDAVYTYARATSEARAEIDLSSLSEDEQEWLMAVPDADLDKMAAAGRIACILSLVNKAVSLPSKQRTGRATEESEPQIEGEDGKKELLRHAYLSRRVGSHPHTSFPSSSFR